MPVLEPHRVQAGSGFRLAMQSFGASVLFFASPYITFETLQITIYTLLVTGVILVYVLDRFFARIDPPKQLLLRAQSAAALRDVANSLQSKAPPNTPTDFVEKRKLEMKEMQPTS